jgi:hypothetical protein
MGFYPTFNWELAMSEDAAKVVVEEIAGQVIQEETEYVTDGVVEGVMELLFSLFQ